MISPPAHAYHSPLEAIFKRFTLPCSDFRTSQPTPLIALSLPSMLNLYIPAIVLAIHFIRAILKRLYSYHTHT